MWLVLQCLNMKFLWLLFCTVFITNHVTGSYVITTPRKWPSDGLAQICASLLDGAVFNPTVDNWHVTINDANRQKELLPKTEISLPEGKVMACRDIRRPEFDTSKATIKIEGQLAGTNFFEEVNVTVGGKVFQTFIQPDKAIYKPGQKVQFRVLTIKEKVAPFIFTTPTGIWKEPYELIYIETPNKVRIAQWRNVTHNGLLHLSMNLHKEAEEGFYRIYIVHGLKHPFSAGFEVKHYTLPRYEVTVTSPNIIYGNSSDVKLKLCAKYTFGQNVRGNGSLSISVGSNRIYANITKHAMIDGCASFNFPTDTLRFDDNNCHIRISSIRVEGKVAEEGVNNVMYLKPTTFNVNRRVITFTDVSKTGIRKSYIPTQLTVKATFSDSSHAASEQVETCTYLDGTNICRNFTTDNNGVLEILLDKDHSSGVKFRAINYPPLEKKFNFVMEESTQYIYSHINKEFSNIHNASVSIYYFNKLICEDGKQITVNLPIIYVTDGQTSADIKIQTMSKGYVYNLYNETIELKNTPMPFNYQQFLVPLKPVPDNIIRGMTNISLTLPLTISPEATITVWFKTKDNSIVADTITLEVTPCLGNEVDFSWSLNETGPGMPAQMTVTAEKNSICSIGVVDRSVELLGAPDKFSTKNIINNLQFLAPRRWDEKQLDLKYCLKKYKNERAAAEIYKAAITNLPSVYRTSVPYQKEIEAIQVFQDAGYHVFSPLNLEKVTCDSLVHKALKSLAELQTNPKRGKPASFALSDNMYMQNAPQGSPQKVAFNQVNFAIDNKEGTVIEETPQERVFFPETWLWELRTLESNQLSETVTLPDTITEWVGSAVCIGRETGVGISNEASITTFTPFFVELNLLAVVKRGEHFPVVISTFSYSKSPISVTLQLEKSPDFDFVDVSGTETGNRTFCIKEFGKIVRTIVIKTKKIGDMNITVEAVSNKAIANCFDPNAIAKSDRIIKPVLVEAEGVTRERVWTKYVCPEDLPNTDVTWNVSVPADIVMDSERAWINVVGDLLGPTLNNIGLLVNLPQGCGEQNLVTFAPDIYLLGYLNASKRLVPELKNKLKNNIALGYQRQLRFARKDGSFSTFGEIDKRGSTWLTSFVLKTFSSRYLTVDQHLINKIVDFLRKSQAPNGCFYENGKVINKAIKGENEFAEESLLTAYVVSTLIEAHLNETERSVITKALPCILKDNSTHPYNLALRAHSLTLAGSVEAINLINQLKVLAITTESEMKWKLPDNVKNSALSVETAAYALLSFLNSDHIAHKESSRKIMRWLSSQRNGRGGFVSTQDTVMSLQALTLFERVQPSKTVNATINVTNSKLDYTFEVNRNNRLVEQRQDVPFPKENVAFKIQGTGCVLIQGVLRYNVFSKSLDEFFSLNVSSTVDENCEYHHLTLCTSYLLADKVSNMANIEVKLVTGYNPIEDDLKIVVLNNPFKRYEIDQGKIIFYLDEITSTPICTSFRVKQDLIVGNAQPGMVKVYDYYQPELVQEKTFDLKACKTSYEICIDPLTQGPVNTQTSNNDLC